MSNCTPTPVTLPPIILINGLIGSVINGKLDGTKPEHAWCSSKSDWFRMWLNLEEVSPLAKDCLLRNLELHYDDINGYSNTSGVEINGNVDFGGVGGLAYLDPSLGPAKGLSGYYNTMIDALKKKGYVTGKNLHGAPYDWRLAADAHVLPHQYYSKLAALIEATVAQNNGTAAYLIAHSLGCPTTNAFLQTRPAAWLNTYVQGFVPINGVWGGSTKMALALVSGDNFDAPVPMDYLQRVQKSAASGAWMLPGELTFGTTAPVVVTDVRNYTAAQMTEMMVDLNLTQVGGIFLQPGA